MCVFAMGGQVACVCGSVTTITRNCCIDPHQTGFVGKGSDHLQLIKFWPSRAPGEGACGGAKFLAALLTASTQCLHLSGHCFSLTLHPKVFLVAHRETRYFTTEEILAPT